ncbi:MAG TPA: FMN-binding negative transcriptional regulator [Longimicrobiaceae bacterium]|jgi:transcriptional regulator
MYVPPSNAEHRPEVLHDFIEAHPLGALVTMSADGLFATHLPLVLHRGRGPHGTLEGHVARASPHHRLPLAADEALVIFSGPDAYVTPSWYAAKAEHGKVVPTWNYVAVHVYGTLRFVEDPAFLRRHLRELTERHEAGRERPWEVADAPAEYIAGLERAIVGVEIAVTRVEGKWKMSQNRPAADIDGVARGLAASPDPGDRAVAGIVEARRPDRT